MGKKASDKNTAAAVASIIRRTVAAQKSLPHEIDWDDEKNIQELDECVAYLNEYDSILGEKFADAEISAQLVMLIHDLLSQFASAGIVTIGTQELQTIVNSIKTWRTSLASRHEVMTYYAVLDGISVDGRVTLGLVQIAPLRQSIEKRIVAEFASKINKSPNFTPERKKDAILSFKKRASEIFLLRSNIQSIVVSTKVDTWDKRTGHENAYQRFEEVMNLVRYLGYLFDSPPGKIGVSMRGALAYDGKVLLATADKTLFSRNHSPHHFQIALSRKLISGAREIIGIFNSPGELRNDVERNIVSAINWIGKGCIEESVGDQLVAFCIALEVLLKGDTQFGYTNVVCERVCFLLPQAVIQQFRYKGNICNRRTFYELMKSIFTSRGDVVHKGDAHLEPQSRHTNRAMALILYSVIVTMQTLCRRNKWVTMDHLFALLMDRKFGLASHPRKKP